MIEQQAYSKLCTVFFEKIGYRYTENDAEFEFSGLKKVRSIFRARCRECNMAVTFYKVLFKKRDSVQDEIVFPFHGDANPPDPFSEKRSIVLGPLKLAICSNGHRLASYYATTGIGGMTGVFQRLVSV